VIPNLLPGTYRLRVEKPGFRAFVDAVAQPAKVNSDQHGPDWVDPLHYQLGAK
jgi:hypothetical protein